MHRRRAEQPEGRAPRAQVAGQALGGRRHRLGALALEHDPHEVGEGREAVRAAPLDLAVEELGDGLARAEAHGAGLGLVGLDDHARRLAAPARPGPRAGR